MISSLSRGASLGHRQGLGKEAGSDFSINPPNEVMDASILEFLKVRPSGGYQLSEQASATRDN